MHHWVMILGLIGLILHSVVLMAPFLAIVWDGMMGNPDIVLR